MNKDTHSLLLIVGLQMILVLPFLGQPFHMDDSIYLDIGENTLKKALEPLDFPYCFEGYCAPDMASHSHPPFISYWIGLLLWIQGDFPPNEYLMHLGFLPFPLLFSFSMFFLAKRFTRNPLMPTLLAASSPVAVVMSHNIMADYPNFALWTAGVTLYIYGVDHKRTSWIASASVLLTLAAFTSYPSLLAAIICLVYGLLKKSHLSAAYWAPVVPFAWTTFWLVKSSLYFGRFVLTGTIGYFIQTKASWNGAALVEKWLVFPIFLAGTIAIPGSWFLTGVRWMKGRGILLWMMTAMVIVQFLASDYPLGNRALMLLLLSVGGILLVVLGVEFWRLGWANHVLEREDELFLFFWFGSVASLILLLYSSVSARYLLPLIPPLFLLSCRTRRERAFPPGVVVNKCGLAASLILAIILSYADFQMASTHRAIAVHMNQMLDGWESKVWFGGEWGFRHYMRRNGYRQFISTSDDMKGGDFILLPREATPYDLPQDVASMTVPVSQQAWVSDFPVQLMSFSSHAGFYSSGWGLLPFSFSSGEIESLSVLQVSYLVENLPEIVVDHADGRSAVPYPAEPTGVDLSVPVPSRISIPYSGPMPAKVHFEFEGWLGYPNNSADSRATYRFRETLRMYYVEGGRGNVTELPVELIQNPFPQVFHKYTCRIPEVGPGFLVMEIETEEGIPKARKIRNLVILPPDWTEL